jgi:hypothetical protein
MSSVIPTASSVRESSVSEAPLASVWHQIKLGDFASWSSELSKSEVVKGASPETDVFKWTFKDGTVFEVKQEEHSVSDQTDPLLTTFLMGVLRIVLI